MSHNGNEELKEQAFNDVVEQYIEQGYTEEEAIKLWWIWTRRFIRHG